MIAYCGLNCANCDAYAATLEDSPTKREEIAQKWSQIYHADIKPEQINCTGCKSNGVKFLHCSVCDIRRCCLSKNVDHCAACPDYVCDTLADFIQLAPEAGRALERLRL
jgi:hypothetical protein